jgi:glutamine synthetase type III
MNCAFESMCDAGRTVAAATHCGVACLLIGAIALLGDLHRYREVGLSNFALDVEVEANAMAGLLNQRVINAAIQLQTSLKPVASGEGAAAAARYERVAKLTDGVIRATKSLESAIRAANNRNLSVAQVADVYQTRVRPAMAKSRNYADQLEMLSPSWPITPYNRLLFNNQR